MSDINNMTYEELFRHTMQLSNEMEIFKETQNLNHATIERLNEKIFIYEEQLMYFKELIKLIVGGKGDER